MALRGRERRKGLLSFKERVMAKRPPRRRLAARCVICKRGMTSYDGRKVCVRCYRLAQFGPARVLKLKARLDKLLKEVLMVQTWFARHRMD